MLAAYPVYFGGIALNVENPNAGSVDPNGIKVRVPGVESFQLTGEALGYIPSPIPFFLKHLPLFGPELLTGSSNRGGRGTLPLPAMLHAPTSPPTRTSKSGT